MPSDIALGGPVGDLEVFWECHRCAIEWTTVEPYGTTGSRILKTWKSSTTMVPASMGYLPAHFVRDLMQQYGLGMSVDEARAMLDLGLPEPPKRDPGPPLKELQGSVIGYRAWNLQNWELVGTGGYDIPWHPGINESRCGKSRGHLTPDPDCDCGMYALARFDDRTSWWFNADILGAVEAWADPDEENFDRFFVHSTGFRAQYAQVVLLAVADDYPRVKNAAIRALATEHEADVCKREHLEDAAKEHGQLVPDELLEWARQTEGVALRELTLQAAAVNQGTAAMRQLIQDLSSSVSITTTSRKSKGIKEILRYPGPPSYGKYRKEDRVRDVLGDTWWCLKGGRPGSWEKETSLPF